MNETTLPPSPNFYSNSIIACANGIIAWGAKNIIVIGRRKEPHSKINYSIIEKAHCRRVTSLAFCVYNNDNDKDSVSFIANNLQDYALVSAGDNNTVKVWDTKTLEVVLSNSKLDATHKIVGVDWSKHNKNLICYISENGLLVTWNIKCDISQIISLGRLTATCLSCCPHDKNLLAVGSKFGLVYIVNISGSGKVIHKLRGHDTDIVSLSWCPVPINIFSEESTREFLLASGAKDQSIYLWRAGSDGRNEVCLKLPTHALDTENCKTKEKGFHHTIVNWFEQYTLLSSSSWGELLSWNLKKSENKEFTPKLLHGIHTRELFAIATSTDGHITSMPATNDLNELVVSEPATNDLNELVVSEPQQLVQKTIWTVSHDQQVVCYNVSEEGNYSVDYVIPTQRGFVYCISACPVETSQIAFGAGDGMIRLWNLTDSLDNNIQLEHLHEKISGDVRSLAWHPEKEYLLAYATSEGRIGVFHTNRTTKPPTLYRQCFKGIVYEIGWGPAPEVEEYALYACGDGEVVYYNPEKPNDKPVSIAKKKSCTEFCWKPDYSLLAIAFLNGTIKILNRDLTEYTQINLLNKVAYCMRWHPESTTADSEVSLMENYLAVGTVDSTITIFDIFTLNDHNENNNEKTLYKVITTLNGHSSKIVSLAWSPYTSGYLVSASYDHTAQVWKVETQEIIATFISHTGPLQSCIWSPYSSDVIITGGADSTLRIWRISDQCAIKEPPKISKKVEKTKKKKVANELPNASTDIKIKKFKDGSHLSISVVKESKNENQCVEEIKDKTQKKRKQKTYFKGDHEISSNNKLWYASVRKLLETVESDDQNNEENACSTLECNEIENETKKIPLLLGSKKNIEEILKEEKKRLASDGYYQTLSEMEQWDGNLKEHLQQAMKTRKLDEYLVSLAPIVSMKMWEEVCEAYAIQLVYEQHPHKAVLYLININKIQDAIDVFLTANLYKEAYTLASSRLQSDDPAIKNIVEKWAKYSMNVGHYQNAIECYIKLKEYSTAAKILEKRKDMNSLILAIDLAKEANDLELSTTLADKAVFEALLSDDIKVAQSIIHNNLEIKYREIEVEVYSELIKVLNNINDKTICKWLKGSSNIALLETLSTNLKNSEITYSALVEKDVPILPINNKMIQINVSHQLALSILADQQKLQLENLVKAFDFIVEQKKFSETEEKPLLLIYYIFLLDNKILADSTSLFNSTEDEISKSLRAYLCYAIIEWILDSESNPAECIDSIELILTKCLKDLFDEESLQFWTCKNRIDKIEKKLATSVEKLDINEDNETGMSNLIKELGQLKVDNKKFVDKRVSSPNPLFTFAATAELTSKIKDEQTCMKIQTLIAEACNF